MHTWTISRRTHATNFDHFGPFSANFRPRPQKSFGGGRTKSGACGSCIPVRLPRGRLPGAQSQLIATWSFRLLKGSLGNASMLQCVMMSDFARLSKTLHLARYFNSLSRNIALTLKWLDFCTILLHQFCPPFCGHSWNGLLLQQISK